MTPHKNPAAVSLGRKGGQAGKGKAKRRDSKTDPDYYKRISAAGVAARKLKQDSAS